ncbi:1-acyl-sn-glycerol-3-phosphate acyltransferase [Candidatus Woesearchaeota archaeon]|nr:1-acyl-sn-glycerol-3-phosphate acyltransferase [Candidatus Woesearchaeota archaeon]
MAHAIAKRIVHILLTPWRGKITGIENIPQEGNFIIAANHESYLDHFIISTLFLRRLNKHIYFLAKKELFDTWLKKKFHTWADAIPIDRQSGGQEGLQWAEKALREGKIIAMHPEGTRSLTGALQRGKTGAARLALATDAPVLPVGISGSFEVLPKGKIIPKAGKIHIRIGKLMAFPEYSGMQNDKKAIRTVTTSIMKAIGELAGERYEHD